MSENNGVWEGVSPDSDGEWEGVAPGQDEPDEVVDPRRGAFMGNLLEAERSSPLGIARRYPKAPHPADVSLLDAEMGTPPGQVSDAAMEQYQQKYQEAKQKRVAELMTYADIQGFEKARTFNPEKEGLWETIKKAAKPETELGTSAAGQFVGSALDPVNILPIWKGSTMLRTLLKGATSMGTYNATLEYASQTADIEAGVLDDYDWKAIAVAGGVGGALGAGANAVSKLNENKPTSKTPTDTPIDPDVAALKERAPAKDADVDTSKMKNPYFAQARKDLKATDQYIWEGVSPDDPAHSQMDMRQDRPVEPWWPDPDLQKAIGRADRQADKAGTFELPYDGPGKGQDVDASSIQSPYMSKYEVADAERLGEPAAWEHHPPIRENLPPDNSQGTLLGKRFEDHPDSVSPIQQSQSDSMKTTYYDEIDRMGRNYDDPKFIDELRQADTIEKGVAVAGKYARDPNLRALANKLGEFLKDIPLQTRMFMPVHGSLTMTGGGDRIVRLDRQTGYNPETVMHEGSHAVTSHAYLLGKDPSTRDLPRYRKHREFADRLDWIFKNINWGRKAFVGFDDYQRRLFENARENPREMLAYAWTNPEFRMALDDVKLPDSELTGWQAIWRAIKRFFGYDPDSRQTALDAILKLQDDIPHIQDYDKGDLGKIIDGLYAQHLRGEAMDFHKGDITPSKDIDPDWTATEAWMHNDGQDLKAVPKTVVTTNQLSPGGRTSKLMNWGMAKIGQIYRQSAPRFYDYHQKLKPYMFDRKTKLHRDDLVKTFKTLVDIQDPKLKEARRIAEETNTREALLEEYGLSGRNRDFAITVLDIMKDVHTKDAASAKRLGRDLKVEPMYFPRIHGGKYVVKVLDSSGEERYVKGHKSYDHAREDEARLLNQLRDDPDLTVQRVQQTGQGNFADDFSQIMLEHEIPMKFLKEGLKNAEKKSQSAPMFFEKKRRDDNVGGYVGEHVKDHHDQEQLLQAMSWRLLASKNFEIKSRILNEIKFPLFETGMLSNLPNLRLTLGSIVNRELGVDISGNKWVDEIAQDAVELSVKGFKAVDHFIGKHITGKKDFDFRWDDPMVSKDAARDMVRWWTYFTSLVKLALNTPVLLTNLAHPSLLGLDGIRTAANEDINPGYAMSANMKALLYGAGARDPDAVKFMKQAEREGMFEPHSQEHYTTAELPDRSHWDKAVQMPRDKIEQFANRASIVYYYYFYKDARPDLKGEALASKVYEAARSFTGQYEQFAAPLMFDKAGTAGQLFTNFSKWHFNQLGRLLDDVKQLGAGRTATPILMTSLMTGVSAGIYGLPFVVEYEAIRRLMQEFGVALELPPISALRGKFKDTIPAWEWLEKGVFTGASNALAQMLGASSGPDLSASMRYSAIFDTPTVAIQHFWDIITKTAPWMVREALAMGTGKYGNTPKQTEDMLSGVPPVIKGFIRGNVSKEKMTVNGKTVYAVRDLSDNNQQLYTLDEVENAYGKFGLRSAREIKQIEAINYEKYLERESKKDMTKWKGRIMDRPNDKQVFLENIKLIAEHGGKKAVDETIEQLKTRTTAKHIDYFTAEAMKAVKNADGIQRKRLYDRITKAKRLAE